MHFLERRRRRHPTIIIVALIDVLVVLLIFLVTTTTFKQQPAIRLVLPESRQPREGARVENVVITIAREAPYYYLGQTPVTLDQLQAELKQRAAQNPEASVAVRGDTEAALGRFVTVMDLVKAAGFKNPVNIWTRPAGQ